MSRKFWFLAFFAVSVLGFVAFLKVGTIGTNILWNISGEGVWLLPLVLVSALLDSINPCAFSILFLTIAFLFSLGKDRRSVLKIGGTYILGIAAAYLMIGLGLFGTLHLFATPHFMAKAGALLLVVLGSINLLGEIFPSFPVRFGIPAVAHRKIASLMNRATLPAAFLLGALVGLCEFPCTGGPYLMVLGLLHDQGTYLAGVGYLLIYNAVFVLPLAVLLGLASDAKLMDKVNAWRKAEVRTMRVWGAVAMVALGLLVYLIS